MKERKEKLGDTAKVSATMKAGASGQIAIEIDPPKCFVPVDAMDKCLAGCGPAFKPGKLEASCKGGEIVGKCEAECKGSCTADVGAQCTGTCKAAAPTRKPARAACSRPPTSASTASGSSPCV